MLWMDGGQPLTSLDIPSLGTWYGSRYKWRRSGGQRVVKQDQSAMRKCPCLQQLWCTYAHVYKHMQMLHLFRYYHLSLLLFHLRQSNFAWCISVWRQQCSLDTDDSTSFWSTGPSFTHQEHRQPISIINTKWVIVHIMRIKYSGDHAYDVTGYIVLV